MTCGPKLHCEQCDQWWPPPEWMEHLRVEHPDVWAGLDLEHAEVTDTTEER